MQKFKRLHFLLLILLFCSCKSSVKNQNQISDTTDFSNFNSNTSLQIDTAKSLKSFIKGIENLEKKRYKIAIESFNESVIYNPKFAEAYEKRAIAKFYSMTHNDFMQDIDTAIILNLNFAEAYFYRGIFKCNYENNIQQNHGCSDIQKSIELGYKIDTNIFQPCKCDNFNSNIKLKK